jgi:hypothetical protein
MHVVSKIVLCAAMLVGVMHAVPFHVISPAMLNGTTSYTITQSGLYQLSDNVVITSGGAAAMTINTSNVTLDLNGKAISAAAGANGIHITGGDLHNITIRNGSVERAGTAIQITSNSTIVGLHVEDLNIIETFGGGGLLLSNNVTLSCVTIRNCLFASDGIFAPDPSCSIDDFSMDGCTLSGGTNVGFFMTTLFGASSFSFNNCKFNSYPGSAGCSIVCPVKGLKFTSCSFNNNVNGLNLGSSLGASITDCTFSANANNGFSSATNNLGLVFRNNTATLNGLGFSFSNDRGIISNCTAASNGTIGFFVGTGVTLLGCLAYDNSTANYMATGAGRVGYVVVNNGAQVGPDMAIDPNYDNVSIV